VAEPTLHDLDRYGRSRGVLLISIDTLRRDRVGAYGHARPTTPRLDALAREGLLCEDAVSTSSWTLPAHLSMLTSVDAGVHGGVDGQSGFNHSVPTLAELLRGAGFATRAVTSHLYVSPTYGLDAGFERFDFIEDREASDVAERALGQLDQVGDRDFFLFLHFYDAHAHYDPPPETRELFPSPYRGPLAGLLGHFQRRSPASMPPGYLEHLLSLYDGEIRSVDDQIGRILDHLRLRGLDRSTLVLVTSDHGEEFLDHGSWIHGRSLYEEIVRIPLIVRGPGVRVRRESSQVSLLDVAPTILEWAGQPIPAAAQGTSLLRPVPAREAFGDKGHAKDGVRKLFLRGGQGRYKLILSLDPASERVLREEWYDLVSDPGERRVTAPPAAEADALRGRAMARWRASRAGGGQGVGVTLTPEQRERLRALGYLGT
jgi:arylsulfatase A-like enzyme